MIEFPVSGVETYWWLPIVVAFGISSLTSAGGVTGAFVLLPFQMSFLGFVGPAVSPTNLVYNIIAAPGGVFWFWREQRMVWSLAGTLIFGTLPGIFIGALIRIKYLPDPRHFKLFVACVLLYLGIKVTQDVISGKTALLLSRATVRSLKTAPRSFEVTPLEFSISRLRYEFDGCEYSLRTWVLLIISIVVGIVGGTYGIGGGAFLAPILVSIFGLPVYTVAGATLLATFTSSIAGVAFYTAIAPHYADTGLAISPDFILGAMFGLGGMAGVYTGARIQRYIPAWLIKSILALGLLFIASQYFAGFFA